MNHFQYLIHIVVCWHCSHNDHYQAMLELSMSLKHWLYSLFSVKSLRKCHETEWDLYWKWSCTVCLSMYSIHECFWFIFWQEWLHVVNWLRQLQSHIEGVSESQKLAFVVVCNMNVSQNVCHQLVNPIRLYFRRKKYGKTNKYSTTSILFCMFNNYPHEYSLVNRGPSKTNFLHFQNTSWK